MLFVSSRFYIVLNIVWIESLIQQANQHKQKLPTLLSAVWIESCLFSI